MYISCEKTDKYFLYRYIDSNTCICKISRIPYTAELFLESVKDQNSKFKGFKTNKLLKKYDFNNSKEFYEFKTKFENKVYGNVPDIYQYLSTVDINIENIKYLKIWSLDIETYSEDDFPSVEKANKYPIIVINIHNIIDDKKYSWILDKECKCSKKSKDNWEIKLYVNEKTMLSEFINFWKSNIKNIHILTGWNTKTYDIPYIFNRLKSEFGNDSEEMIKDFSPFKIVRAKTVRNRKTNENEACYQIYGIPQLDYLNLFEKFPKEPYPSNKLEDICQIELGYGKLDHSKYNSFADFYNQDINNFVEYNMIDNSLIRDLDKKFKYINLAITIALECRINYEDIFSPVKCWEGLTYNELKKDNFYIYPRKSNYKEDYMGAYVMEPEKNLYEAIVSYDLTSLYPSVIIAGNISPETIIENKENKDASIEKFLAGYSTKEIYGNNIISDPAGNLFIKDFQGVIPKIMKRLFENRVLSNNLKKKKQKELVELKQKLKNIEGENK